MFPKGATDPTRVDEPYPRRPTVRTIYSRSACKGGGRWLSGCDCIESGDDLYPEFRGLAFGRLVGVGADGSLTGLHFANFFFIAILGHICGGLGREGGILMCFLFVACSAARLLFGSLSPWCHVCRCEAGLNRQTAPLVPFLVPLN